MAQAVLALGANIGDPPRQMADAVAAIGAHPQIEIKSQAKPVITKAWGKTDQPDFLNCAVLVQTDLDPLALLDAVLAIEASLGRVRYEHWGPRLIDIDVISYERLEMVSDRLTLPHPYAHERDFVLGPVREIAPEVADWLITRKTG